MKQSEANNEIRELSHISLVMVIMGFSIILIVLNIILGWEKWTIPIAACVTIVCPVMHVSRKLDENVRLNIYSVILIIQIFYYSFNASTVYDSAPAVVVALILLAMTQIKYWVVICLVVGYLGMGMHLIQKGNEGGLILEFSHIVRTAWAFVVIFFAAIVVGRLINAWARMRSRYEEEIETVLEENKSATDFLANVSHEIRTPVNVVIGLTGVCAEQEKDPIIKNNMLSIKDAGKRVSEQISDILDYSEIDRGHLSVNEEDYMISSLLTDVVNELKILKESGLELVIDVDPLFPNVLHSDASKIKKILWHLIGNGLKYTKEGGVYVHIFAKTEEYGINLCIEVTDTGVGMNSDEVDRIFDQFYQSDSGRTRSTSGLGLGLSIVSGFVRSLGGFLTVSSTPDVGTTINVSIPQKVVDPEPCATVSRPGDIVVGGYLHFDKFPFPRVREFYNNAVFNLVKGLHVNLHRVDNIEDFRRLQDKVSFTHLFVGQEEYESDAAFMEELSNRMLVMIVAEKDYKLPKGSRTVLIEKPMYAFPIVSYLNRSYDDDGTEVGKMRCDGIRALVVDDEPMNLVVARGVLERYGMTVTFAESGFEAVKDCRENTYDIVFMDHMMPGMDGVEAMKRIRSDSSQGKKRYFPIVMLTANAVSSAREMFMREGFDGFISKPIDLVEMERVLKRVLPISAITYDLSNDEHDGHNDAVSAETQNNESEVMEFEAPGESMVAEFAPGEMKNPDSADSGGGDIDKEALVECGINYDNGMKFCMGDEAFYKTVLSQYANDGEGKRELIKNAYHGEDWTNYKVYVHALKSSSKTIGAMELFELARKLEEAAGEKKIDYITEHEDKLISLYEKVNRAVFKAIGEDKAQDILQSEDDGDDEILEFLPEEEV